MNSLRLDEHVKISNIGTNNQSFDYDLPHCRSESSNNVSLTPDKATGGLQAQDDQTSGSAGVETRTGAKRLRLESNEDGKDSQAPPVPPTPAIRTSTRIIKRKEKDNCQSETPVKKPGITHTFHLCRLI